MTRPSRGARAHMIRARIEREWSDAREARAQYRPMLTAASYRPPRRNTTTPPGRMDGPQGTEDPPG